jgi:hypothetical protein
LRFALRFEACGKFFADRIVAHKWGKWGQ